MKFYETMDMETMADLSGLYQEHGKTLSTFGSVVYNKGITKGMLLACACYIGGTVTGRVGGSTIHKIKNWMKLKH